MPEQYDADDKEAYTQFARDWAGLEFLSSIPQLAHNIPKFYGASKQHRFILIEDLGEQHVSLVDSLTVPNQKKAIAALTRFMEALGSFHATTFGHTEHYEKILHRIHVNAETVQEELDFTLKDLLPKLELANKQLNLPVTQSLIDEAIDIITTMLSPSPFTVLTHGDICPDNVFDHAGKDLQLIDFEWSFVQNALLDGAYLRMSIPTCWCAKAIPIDLIILNNSLPHRVENLCWSHLRLIMRLDDEKERHYYLLEASVANLWNFRQFYLTESWLGYCFGRLSHKID